MKALLFSIVLSVFSLGVKAQDVEKYQPNLRTLNFYLPVQFLNLPCYAAIDIRGAYNSYSGGSSILGKKWTFNYNVRIETGMSYFEVIEGDGFRNRYTREKNLEDANKALVQSILVEVRKQDAQRKQLRDQKFYEELSQKLLSDRAMREAEAQRLITSARPLGAGTYYSLMRGRSTLEKKADGSFERKFSDGSTQGFDSKGRLVRSEDRNGNRLDFVYQNDQLARISDACGGSAQFVYYDTPALQGLLKQISDSLNRKVAFVFDQARQLREVNGPEGATRSFRYDAQSNMVELKNSADQDMNFELKYNEAQEVSEKKGPGNARVTYKRSFVGEDRNHSITEITFFRGDKREKREVHEYKIEDFEQKTQYNAQGEEVSRRITRFSSTTGFPETELDEKGRGHRFEYYDDGRVKLRESLPSGETLRYVYPTAKDNEIECQFPEALVRERKNAPSVNIKFDFDKKCNLHHVTEKTGDEVTTKIEVRPDERGRPSFIIDETRKQALAITHWKGKPESITLRDTGTLFVKYKPNGEFGEVNVFPHGKGEKRFEGQTKEQYQPVILSEVQAAITFFRDNYLRPAGLDIGL